MEDKFTYTQWCEEFAYEREYIVSEAVNPGCRPLNPKLMETIEIGDVLAFYKSSTAFCKIVRDGYVIAECPIAFLPGIFCIESRPPLDPKLMMYRLSSPEDAEAIISGVPSNDVYA